MHSTSQLHQKDTEIQQQLAQLQEKDVQIHKREAELRLARIQLQQKDTELNAIQLSFEVPVNHTICMVQASFTTLTVASC